MINQGCDCEGARRASIAFLNVKGFKEAFETFNKIPAGVGAAELATWIINNIAPSKKDGSGGGIWDMTQGLSIKSLYRAIAQDCCINTAFKNLVPESPYDLYRVHPTIDTLGIDDRMIKIDK